MTIPRLSITVLNYNYEHYLPRCLDSILGQTYEDFELILIDDCSPRSPVEVIKPYLSDKRVRFAPHVKNRGFAASLIEGTEELSRGEILTVISADDFVLRNDAFELQVEQLDQNPGAVFSMTGGALAHEDGRRTPLHPYPCSAVLSPYETFTRFLFDPDFWAIHSGSMIPRDAYVRAGGYPRDIFMPLDLALFLKVCLEGATVYCNEELYGYGVHDGQMTSSKFRKNAIEVSRLVAEAARDGKQRFGMNPFKTRLNGTRRQLEPILQNEAYSGDRRTTLAAIAAWLSIAPLSTLTARSMWLALAHVALGSRGFHALQFLNRRAHGRPEYENLP